MVLGIAVGLLSHAWLSADQTKGFTDILGLVTTIFLRLIKMIIAPLVFSTLVVGIAHMEDAAAIGRVGASSEAAYPKLLENLQTIGLPRAVVSFVLPLGYSFNLDGSMMYCTFATLFIAQAYHIDLTLSQQITLLLLMMITSKGMAGVPRASLVVIAAALPYFHLPEAGLLLVLAVDHLLDMGRSGTNIVGNSVACVVVDAWDGRKVTRPS